MIVEFSVLEQYIRDNLVMFILCGVVLLGALGLIVGTLVRDTIIGRRTNPAAKAALIKTIVVGVLSVAVIGGYVGAIGTLLAPKKVASNTQDEAVLTRIDVITPPDKLEYEAGEFFDPTGMVVQATYSDATTKTVEDYTLSKKADESLGKGDYNIVITYKTKSCSLDIKVNYPMLDITGLGNYVVEAEDLSSERWVAQAGREGMFYETVSSPATASGNKFVGSIVSGTVVSYRFTTDAKYTVGIVCSFAKYEENYSLKNNAKIYIDGQEVNVPEVQFGHTEEQRYTYWQDVNLGFFALDAGEHTFRMDIVSGMGPNMDCFRFSVAEYDPNYNPVVSLQILSQPNKTDYVEGETFDPTGMVVEAKYFDGTTETITDYTIGASVLHQGQTVSVSYQGISTVLPITVNAVAFVATDSQSYIVEAESLDQSSWVIQPGREGMQIENPTTHPTSGGASVGSLMAGSKLIVFFRLETDANLSLTAYIAQINATYNINNTVRFTMDGASITHGDVVFGGTGAGDYYNWQPVVFDTLPLTAGSHVFIMEIVGEGCNIDCFRFDVAAVGMETLTDIEITTQPTKTVYANGESFDPTGMVVVAKFSDREDRIIGGYTVDESNMQSGEVVIRFLGKSVSVSVQVDMTKQKLSAPTNNDDQFRQSGVYTEANRSGVNLFTEGVDYVLVHIYDESKSVSLGAFKIVCNTADYNSTQGYGEYCAMDGTHSIATMGAARNIFAGNAESEVKELMRYALGSNYTAGTYYVAVQRIASAEPVNGITYVDSDISPVGTQGWVL